MRRRGLSRLRWELAAAVLVGTLGLGGCAVAVPGDAPEPVDALPSSEDVPETVDVLPSSEDAPEPVDALLSSEDVPEPMDAQPSSGDAPEPVDAQPSSENAPETVDALPSLEDAPESMNAPIPAESAEDAAAPGSADAAAQQPEAPAEPLPRRIPPALREIPEGYTEPAEQQGRLEELYYYTYESYGYAEREQALYKRAIVYLPYGYDGTERYEVLYWMHGGSRDETALLGEPGEESEFKNVVDHAIESGEICPLIIVCPTYRNVDYDDTESPDIFATALELTQAYHQELTGELIPLVDGIYSTYAEGTSEEALIAAREHRRFAGYSNGSVATWYLLAYCPEYFHDYLAMSCGTELEHSLILEGLQRLRPEEYYVWTITGSEDFAYDDDTERVRVLWRTAQFSPATTPGGNLALTIAQGYRHGDAAALVYTYNGLRFFYGTGEGANP